MLNKISDSDSDFFWICGYRFCVLVSFLEAFAMGCSVLSLYRWNSTVPTPASEASHEIPTGQLGSKCARTVLSVSI